MGWRDVQKGVSNGSISYAPKSDNFGSAFNGFASVVAKSWMDDAAAEKAETRRRVLLEETDQRELTKLENAERREADKLQKKTMEQARTLASNNGLDPTNSSVISDIIGRINTLGVEATNADLTAAYQDGRFTYTPGAKAFDRNRGEIPASAQAQNDAAFAQEMRDMSGTSGVREALRTGESANISNATNTTKDGRLHSGFYQMGDARLAGYNNEFGTNYTAASHKNLSEEEQEKIADWHFDDIDKFIDNNNLEKYIGQTMNGTTLTRASLVAMAHLGGNGGMRKYLQTNGASNPSDTSVKTANRTSLADYASKFANAGESGSSVTPVDRTEEAFGITPKGKPFDIDKYLKMTGDEITNALALDDSIPDEQRVLLEDQARRAYLQAEKPGSWADTDNYEGASAYTLEFYRRMAVESGASPDKIDLLDAEIAAKQNADQAEIDAKNLNLDVTAMGENQLLAVIATSNYQEVKDRAQAALNSIPTPDFEIYKLPDNQLQALAAITNNPVVQAQALAALAAREDAPEWVELIKPSALLGKTPAELREIKDAAIAEGAPETSFTHLDSEVTIREALEANADNAAVMAAAKSTDSTRQQLNIAIQNGGGEEIVGYLTNLLREYEIEDARLSYIKAGGVGGVATDVIITDEDGGKSRGVAIRSMDGTYKDATGTPINATNLSGLQTKALEKIPTQVQTEAAKVGAYGVALSQSLIQARTLVYLVDEDERLLNAGGSVAVWLTNAAEGTKSILSVVEGLMEDNPDGVTTEADIRAALETNNMDTSFLSGVANGVVGKLAAKTNLFESTVLALAFNAGAMAGQTGNALSNKDFANLLKTVKASKQGGTFIKGITTYMNLQTAGYGGKADALVNLPAITGFKRDYGFSPITAPRTFGEIVADRNNLQLTDAYAFFSGGSGAAPEDAGNVATMPIAEANALMRANPDSPEIQRYYIETYGQEAYDRLLSSTAEEN